MGLKRLQKWRWSAWLASGGGRLVGCSSPAVPAWRLKVIGRELQLRQISKNAASSQAAHIYASVKLGAGVGLRRGGGARGGYRLLQKLVLMLMLILVLMPVLRTGKYT